MSSCNASILNAYIDGELDPARRRELEQHLAACADCARELAGLREVTELFRSSPLPAIQSGELTRIHNAIDDDADRPILRLGGALGTIAASILIVASAWLMQLPSSPSKTLHPQSTASAQAWEQVAMTLRVEPPSTMNDRIELADAMLDGLTPPTEP